jgi:ABC-2 type transport system ATP-binding protein
MTPTLVTEDLSRWYGQVVGVYGITTSIGAGVTGLLGQNGAGKSTLLNLLAGQLVPDIGHVLVCGKPVAGNWRIYHQLGYFPDLEKGFEYFTGLSFLTHHLRVGGVRSGAARKRAQALLELNGLTPAAKRRVGGYSKGMKQRLKLAYADAFEPEVMLLDEPLTGLDPPGRAAVCERIRGWGQQGRTVLVSSHILPEVESLTRRVLLIHHGRLLAEGDISEIRLQMDEIPRTVQLQSDHPIRVRQWLAGLPCVISMHDGEGSGELTIETRHLEEFTTAVNKAAAQQRWNLSRLTCPDEKLESIFNDLLASQGGPRGMGG